MFIFVIRYKTTDTDIAYHGLPVYIVCIAENEKSAREMSDAHLYAEKVLCEFCTIEASYALEKGIVGIF